MIVATIGTTLILSFSRIQASLWRKLYFKSLLEKNAGFFDLNPESASGSSINTECKYIEEAIGDDLMLFISSTALFLGLWVVAIVCSLELSLICLIIFPSQYLGVFISNAKNSDSHKNTIDMYDRATFTSEETLENIKTVASLNCQNSRIHQFSENLKPLKDPCIKAGIFDGIAWGLIYSVMFAVIGIMFYIATLYIIEEKETWVQSTLDISDVLIVYYSSFMGSSLIGISSTSLKKILRGAASANKIIELSIIPEFTSKNLQLYETPWEIRYKNVEFIYPSKPSVKVLKDISFNITPGEKVGLVGSTGCGKSSIAQLLLGFYHCSSGTIEFNGVNIQDLDIKFVRERISYVNQEPLLYSTTIKKNIKLGRLDCTDEEIVDAAKCAEAFDFIEDMPKKMKSYVGIKGSQLSGGEKQRIALARCFMRKPKILIMDEATSALDAITEEKILENITNRFPDTSMLVIAQKLKTLRNTDVIYVIDDGKIIEKGSFDKLIDNKGYFYKLSESDKQLNNSREISEVVEI